MALKAPLIFLSTTALLALPLASTGSAHAQSPHRVATVAARSPLGDDPKNRNGSGPLKIRLTNTADGRIKVSWKGKGPRKNFKPWKIVTSTSRKLNTDKHVYHAKGKKRSIVVKAAPSVVPASGDYTFVKVYAKRKHHLKGGSSPVHWIQAPVTAVPTGDDRLVLGTFNVRDADIKDTPAAYAWDKRAQNVYDTIKGSGAGIVNLQEASGDTGSPAYLYQAQDIERGTGYALVDSGFYRSASGSIQGKQGTRILYNSNLYRVVDHGQQLLPGTGESAPWVAWAEFEEAATGKRFFDVSMHLQTGNSAADEQLRVKQAAQVIDLARTLASQDGGREVFVAGDSNSTIYSKPKGLVHRQFISQGFYDAFASASISGQAYPTTDDFTFPVTTGPYRRDVILSYNGPQGSFWYKNLYYTSAANVASDHFMQVAQLPLG